MFMKNKMVIATVVAGLAMGSLAIAQIVQPKSVGSESFFLIGSNGNSLELRPGTIGTSFSLTLPGSDGTNGQVMQTDGAGTLSWTSAATSGVPSGTIITFAGPDCPTGYLPADGASVSRATYDALFDAIGTTWGSVDGSSFNVPDMRNRFMRGTGTNGDLSGGTPVGLGTYQGDVFASHSHGFSTNTANSSNIANGAGVYMSNTAFGAGTHWIASTNLTNTVLIQNSGGAETRPKSYGVLICIKE